MKAVLALCFFATAANAISLSLSARAVANCTTTCGVEPTLNQTVKCASKKWVPEYEKSGECECLKRYRCCSDTCAKADNETCWNNGNKGQFHLRFYCKWTIGHLL